MVKLETRRMTEASASFVVGERVFHIVTEIMTVRSDRGKMLTAFVSPIALLILRAP